jgi:HSP20 family molecular chaperone IbpA
MQANTQSWLAHGRSARSFAVPSLAASWLGFTQQDDADAVTFRLRVSGYRRRDLTIDVRGRVITVRGERTDGWLKQRSKKSFVHTFELPEALDEHDVRASFAGEVLQLRIAKKPHARRRQIPIHSPGATQRAAPQRTADVARWRRLSGWLRDFSERNGPLLRGDRDARS